MVISDLNAIVLVVIIGLVLFFGAVRLIGWIMEERE